MKVKDAIALPKGSTVRFRGYPATVTWTDKIEYLVSKGDKAKNEPDIYWRSASIHLTGDSIPEGVTLTTGFPDSEMELEDFEA